MSFLFHGPRALDVAYDFAKTKGRLLCPPLGLGKGPRIEESRQLVELLEAPSLDGKCGVVMMGPMDQSTVAAADVLLKTLEEYDSNLFCIVLWAHHLELVRPTIRSRTFERWCPGRDNIDDDMVSQANKLVLLAKQRDYTQVVKFLLKNEMDFGGLLLASSVHLKEDMDAELWQRIRECLAKSNPTVGDMLVTYLLE